MFITLGIFALISLILSLMLSSKNILEDRARMIPLQRDEERGEEL